MPDTSLPSIGPRRMSAVSVPLQAVRRRCALRAPERDRSPRRAARARSTSARSAGSVAPSVCIARTLTRAGVSSMTSGDARQLRRGGRVTLDRDFRIGLVPAFDPDGADGHLDRQRFVRREAESCWVWRSVTSTVAPSASAAARTIHTRALYFRHMHHGARVHRCGRCVGAERARASWRWRSSRDPAAAQVLPEEPISLAGGHVVFGAEVSATFAPEDPGFFNYTSYEFSALRNLRLGVSAEMRANDHLQVLGEVRLDQGRVLEAYGLFVRLRPWPARRFDIQAGRIPPTFGAMSRTAYGSSNILIGQPLAYQYLMSIQPDALPATNDDLLRMRGRGWLSNFPVGNSVDGPGAADRQHQPMGHRRAGCTASPGCRVDRSGDRGLVVGSAIPRQQRRPSVRRARGGAADGRARCSASRRHAARGSTETLERRRRRRRRRRPIAASRVRRRRRVSRRARSWCAAR